MTGNPSKSAQLFLEGLNSDTTKNTIAIIATIAIKYIELSFSFIYPPQLLFKKKSLLYLKFSF